MSFKKNLQFSSLSPTPIEPIYYMCMCTYLIYKFFRNSGPFASHLKFLKAQFLLVWEAECHFSSFIDHLWSDQVYFSTQVSFSASPFSADAQATSVDLLLLIQEKALILQTTSCYS